MNNIFEEFNKKIKEELKKGNIKTYAEFCETPESDLYCVSEEEAKYYALFAKNKYKIGDIVYVLNYSYKSGLIGKNHLFVLVADNTVVDINFFGFLISSHLDKIKYKTNVYIKKNNTNNLDKDSIIKCDDLIIINNNDILYKIGKVSIRELKKFINVYNEYSK